MTGRIWRRRRSVRQRQRRPRASQPASTHATANTVTAIVFMAEAQVTKVARAVTAVAIGVITYTNFWANDTWSSSSVVYSGFSRTLPTMTILFMPLGCR